MKELDFNGTPMLEKQPQLFPVYSQNTEGLTPKPESKLALDGVKLLLVEDCPDNRILFSKFLQNAGAVVNSASNGMEALNKLREGAFDIVLLDMQLPDMTGQEVMEKLRAEGNRKPILALTGFSGVQEKRDAISSGFSDYLVKPIERQMLIKSVLRWSKEQ